MRTNLFLLLLLSALLSWSCDDENGSIGGGAAPINGTLAWQNPLPHGNRINDMVYTPSGVGWLVGTGGLMQKSLDGGATWTDVESGTHYELKAICFADDLNGWAVGGLYVAG